MSPEGGPDVSQGGLYEELQAQSHDAMYRAMSYLTRCGGPSIKGSPDDVANLIASRRPMLAWLGQRHDKDKIVEGYAEFRRTWSPIYPE